MTRSKQMLNRGNNLVAVALISALALSGAYEIFVEGSRGAIDEVAILLIAAVGAAWYRYNRYHRSLVPAAIIGGPLVFKVAAFLVEDVDDKGDDLIVVAMLLISLVIWAVVYYRTRSIDDSPSADGAPAMKEQVATQP